MLDGRPTGDVVILIMAATVCLVLLCAGAGLTLIEVLDPSRDTADAIASIAAATNTLTGAIIGYLAGRRPLPSGGAGEARRPGAAGGPERPTD